MDIFTLNKIFAVAVIVICIALFVIDKITDIASIYEENKELKEKLRKYGLN